MNFNFRKIGSVLASAVMLGSTIGLAAANYPAPFVKSGAADVAVVWGSNAANTDLAAVVDITTSLQTELAKQTAISGGTTGTTVSGEATPLFSGSSRIYLNDSLNHVKASVTDTDLPLALADGSFSGNVDATYTQTVILGSAPLFKFDKMPTSDDEPDFGLTLSTSSSSYAYNATVTFNKAVNLSHSDSEGQDLELFGQTFTIGSATDGTNIVLLKSAEKVSLTSDAPTATVTVAGKEYTIELVSASDTTATVKVTDADGNSETKEVTENNSKKIRGVTVAVTNADETNLKLSASVIAGAEKVTLTDGSAVTTGEDDDTIDGTKVSFTGNPAALTKLTVQVYAAGSDTDALKVGQSLVDPVFGSFKIDFPSVSVPLNSSAREEISIANNGDDRMSVKLTDYDGNEKTIQFAKNLTGSMELQADNDGKNITVFESQSVHVGEYIMVGNEADGRLIKVDSITNATSGYLSDKVAFKDAFSGDTYTASNPTSEGVGATVTIDGKIYTVSYLGLNGDSEGSTIRVNSPDSTAATSAVIYPTIKTSKGALLAFYEPVAINLTNWDGSSTTLGTLRFPDGDGYSDATFAAGTGSAAQQNWTISGAGSGTLGTGSAAAQVNVTVGKLTYALSASTLLNKTTVRLTNPSTGAEITTPALIMFEERDDNSAYEAIVVTLEPGASSDDGIGVDTVLRTWGSDAVWAAVTTPGDSDVTKKADFFGSVITRDAGDSDQVTATISYPDEQVYANLYLAEDTATIEGGTAIGGGTVKELGSVAVKDSEANSVSTKNLIVVGGSCVNTVASTLLGGAGCGESFTTKTGVGANQFLIQTFSQTGGKVATLVAGYNDVDTRNAAKFFITQPVDTTAGKKYIGTSATSATLQTTATTNSTA